MKSNCFVNSITYIYDCISVILKSKRMKKLLFSALVLSGGVFTSKAQLADGSIAPDFNVTAYQSWLSTAGMNGNGTYSLYDYLDAGYTVILDVSATWCGPCWSYHTGGALEDFYAAHGPAGYPGVNAGTTDDAMVIWIEGDGTTSDATMLDGSGTIGNWVTPTAGNNIQFPMANPASTQAGQINDNFAIGYFPTIYKICPNRTVTEVGQLSATQLYSSIASCPPPASAAADAAMLSFGGENEICPGEYTPVVTIQNNGTANMTSATVTITLGGNTVSTGTFSGNLATYGTSDVVCSTISSFNGGTLVATVTTASDNNAGNGTVNKVVSVNNNPAQAATNMVKVDITSDQYASETTWEITDPSGAVIASGGPWSNLGASGTTVRPTVNVNGLSPNTCYKFTIYDSYGDGICCAYGNGVYTVKDATNAVLLTGGEFTDVDGGLIKAGTASVVELDITEFNVYPNPAEDVLNVSFNAQNGDYTVAIVDLQGRELASQILTGLNGAQLITFPVSELAKGSYLVKISSNGVSETRSVVIR